MFLVLLNERSFTTEWYSRRLAVMIGILICKSMIKQNSVEEIKTDSQFPPRLHNPRNRHSSLRALKSGRVISEIY